MNVQKATIEKEIRYHIKEDFQKVKGNFFLKNKENAEQAFYVFYSKEKISQTEPGDLLHSLSKKALLRRAKRSIKDSRHCRLNCAKWKLKKDCRKKLMHIEKGIYLIPERWKDALKKKTIPTEKLKGYKHYKIIVPVTLRKRWIKEEMQQRALEKRGKEPVQLIE